MQGEEGFIYVYQITAYRDLCSLMREHVYNRGLPRFIRALTERSRYTVTFSCQPSFGDSKKHTNRM